MSTYNQWRNTVENAASVIKYAQAAITRLIPDKHNQEARAARMELEILIRGLERNANDLDKLAATFKHMTGEERSRQLSEKRENKPK